MNDEKLLASHKSAKQLIFALSAYIGSSVFGPLILIGGLGYFLDSIFGTKPLILIVSVVIAFITTNLLILRKMKRLSKIVNEKETAQKANKEKNIL
jgi:F0F1-type ATP synthase assembly protein I